jgi:hypothetical protein
VKHRKSSSQLLIAAAVLTANALFSGCAHENDVDKPWLSKKDPWHHTEPHWWQSDLDSQDRSFFYGGFFGN